MSTYVPKPELPLIRSVSPAAVNDFLYQVIAHEFGHLFDFANDVQKTWGPISWGKNGLPRPENDFPHRDALCFYSCGGKYIAREAMKQVYDDLYGRTDFIGTYAATNPLDDFADSFAHYLMAKYLGTSFVIALPDGNRYDIEAKLVSPAFAAKFRYLTEFLARPDLHYPD